MRGLQRQSEPGKCINCHGFGTVDIDTFYGTEEPWEETEDCGVCNGKGSLTVADLERLGWRRATRDTPDVTPA